LIKRFPLDAKVKDIMDYISFIDSSKSKVENNNDELMLKLQKRFPELKVSLYKPNVPSESEAVIIQAPHKDSTVGPRGVPISLIHRNSVDRWQFAALNVGVEDTIYNATVNSLKDIIKDGLTTDILMGPEGDRISRLLRRLYISAYTTED
jgi:hypothetical protein